MRKFLRKSILKEGTDRVNYNFSHRDENYTYTIRSWLYWLKKENCWAPLNHLKHYKIDLFQKKFVFEKKMGNCRQN